VRYIKELDLFEIDCTLDMEGTAHDCIKLRIIPKQCPGGKGVCKESGPDPGFHSVFQCDKYVRMVSDTGEPGIFVDNKLYCKGHNSLKFIMED